MRLVMSSLDIPPLIAIFQFIFVIMSSNWLLCQGLSYWLIL